MLHLLKVRKLAQKGPTFHTGYHHHKQYVKLWCIGNYTWLLGQLTRYWLVTLHAHFSILPYVAVWAVWRLIFSSKLNMSQLSVALGTVKTFPVIGLISECNTSM